MIIKSTFIDTPVYGEIRIRENEYVVVENGIITGIYGSIPPEYANENIIDRTGMIIIPAFNDIHVHAPQFYNRGNGYDLQLLDWLNNYTFPIEEKFADAQFAQKAYRDFVNGLILSGTMRAAIFATVHMDATKILMELIEKSGIKACVGKVNMDRNSPEGLCEDTDKSIDETIELIKWAEGLKNVEYILTPRFVPSVSEKLMIRLGDLAQKYHLCVQSHVSENKDEVELVRRLHPKAESYTRVYDEYGLLRKGRTILAHGIYLTDDEKKIIRDKEIYIAHCPDSNVNLSSGIMRLSHYKELGIKCPLASDVAGGNTLAMNKNAVYAVQISKVNSFINKTDKTIGLSEALYLATKESGQFFGNVGSFDENCEFDALVIDVDSLQPDNADAYKKLQLFMYDGDYRYIITRYCSGKEVILL